MMERLPRSVASWHRVVALGLVLAWMVVWAPPYWAVDTTTLLAAGERLNAGHPLYALSPGDRPIEIIPPYWTVPLLYPPLIAVLWRPVALLGEVGATSLWFGALMAVSAAIAATLLRHTPRTGSAILALGAPFLALSLVAGNPNTLVAAGLLAAWRWADRPWVGALVATLAAIKLFPVLLLVWLVGQRNWGAVAWAAATGVALLGFSIAFAGTDAHAEYLRVALSTEPQPWSLAALTGHAWVSGAILVAGSLASLALASKPAAAFRAAVVALTFGTPAFGLTTPVLLIGLAAPLIYSLSGPGARSAQARRS